LGLCVLNHRGFTGVQDLFDLFNGVNSSIPSF
jgi:hypothetical protein